MGSKKVLFLGVLLLSLAVALATGCDRAQVFTLTVTVEPEGAGEVEPDGGEFEEDTSVTLEATTEEGYYFLEWGGEHGDEVALDEDEGEWKILMNEDKEITAVFSDIEPIVLSVPASLQIEVGESEELQVTVDPDDADISFASSNESVAEVDEDGEITALALGTATITVTATKENYHDAEKEVDVTVVQTLDQVGKPEWDENEDIITWEDVDDAISYEVSLYLDNDLLTSETVDPGIKEHDFSQEIQSTRAGEYTVTVQATGDGEYIVDGEPSVHSDELVKVLLHVLISGDWEITVTIDEDEYELERGDEVTKLYSQGIEVTLSAEEGEETDFIGWIIGQENQDPEDITISMENNTEVTAKIFPTTEFAGGEGTEGDPYQVATARQLHLVRHYLDKHFLQVDHIDLQEFNNWESIGDKSNPFTGNFNGNIYEITGLKIDNPEEDFVGLFGFSQDATLQSITLIDVEITGKRFVGGLIGEADNTTINGCKVSGDIEGNHRVGGLVGSLIKGEVNSCSSDINITGNKDRIGGLIGRASGDHTKINNCYATGNIVTGNLRVGGFIGSIFGSIEIENCYAQVDVVGYRDVGGFVGYATTGMLTDPGEVINSYSTGKVEGNDNLGGFIGTIDEGEIISCYWDTDTSEILYSAGGEGRTTAQMQAGTADSYIKPDGTEDPEQQDENLMYEDWDMNWNFGNDNEYPQHDPS